MGRHLGTGEGGIWSDKRAGWGGGRFWLKRVTGFSLKLGDPSGGLVGRGFKGARLKCGPGEDRHELCTR